MALMQIMNSKDEKSATANENEMQDVSIGIDLGTSNTVISYYNSNTNKVEIIGDDFGNLIPSVVFYQNKNPLVGSLALKYQDTNLVFKSIKRFIGKSLKDLEIESILYEYKSDEHNIYLKSNEDYVSPEQISAAILSYVKNVAEKNIGCSVKKAVITVPAYFDETQRIATKNAASLAGLEVLRLINEPTSAALAYGLDEGIEGLYIVYDLGGGTFDVSILKLSRGIFKVIATGGDTSLGGDDIDKVIYNSIIENNKLDLSRLVKSSLLQTAKIIKEELSSKELVEKQITIGDKTFLFSITRSNFYQLISPIINRTIDICKQAIIDAKIDFTEIKGVVLVGGSTKSPYVQSKVEEFFNIIPLCSLNPDEVVAIGAGYKSGELVGKIQNSLLLDIVPLSLGLETAGGIVEKIIHRNTSIPITKKQEFTTYKDNQTAMLIHILQGERELVDDLRSIGRFSLKGIPPMAAGAARILVSFSIDADGLLFVEAEEITTGVKQSIEIKPSWGINATDMRRMIEESMINAEEDITTRLLIQEKVEASRVVEALQVALIEDGELLPKVEKDIIQGCLNSLLNVMEGQDRGTIQDKMEELDKLTKVFAENRVNKKIQNVLKGKNVQDIANKLD